MSGRSCLAALSDFLCATGLLIGVLAPPFLGFGVERVAFALQDIGREGMIAPLS